MVRVDSPASVLEEIQNLLPFSLPDWLVAGLLLSALLGGLLAMLKYWLPALRLLQGGLRRLLARRESVWKRKRFADHIESQMRRLAEKEEWRDDRYAELEAELEVIGGRRVLRRLPSLSHALRKSNARIALLEGEPGSGKSVAMRHLAQRMAYEVMRSPSRSAVIPLYVNLKRFRPGAAQPTTEDVRQFVFEAVNPGRDRDIERYLETDFAAGMAAGTWLFLFDSFDEIPAVLSATEADEVITAYADALYDFLHGLNTCRGVVASREFRGPGRASWPTFHVVSLSRKRKTTLVKRARLPVEVQRTLLDELSNAEVAIQQMSGNPLFLGLLCEHMRQGRVFPTLVHTVLETYVEHRLLRDAERVRGHFDVEPVEVREIAEELAFSVANEESLGLEVPKDTAIELISARLRRSTAMVALSIEALVYTKLARTGDSDNSVTFSHRRLQEYFATCVVLREPTRVKPAALLAGGRWRETAVTILQTQRPVDVEPLLNAALAALPEVDPSLGKERAREGYDWPPGALYLLGILADGASALALSTVPELSRRVGAILREAWNRGLLYDRKWTLETVSAADSNSCVELLKLGFASNSEWLRQEAYAQIRNVPQVADEVATGIRQMLVDLSVGGWLRRHRRSVLTQIRRLPNPARFESILWALVLAPFINSSLVLLLMVLVAAFSDWSGPLVAVGPMALVLAFLGGRLFLATAATRRARVRALVPIFRDLKLEYGLISLFGFVAFLYVLKIEWLGAVALVAVLGPLWLTNWFRLPPRNKQIRTRRSLERVLPTTWSWLRRQVLNSRSFPKTWSWLRSHALNWRSFLELCELGLVYGALFLFVLLGWLALNHAGDLVLLLAWSVLTFGGAFWTLKWVRVVVDRVAARRARRDVLQLANGGAEARQELVEWLGRTDSPYLVNSLFRELHRRDVELSTEIADFVAKLAGALARRHDQWFAYEMLNESMIERPSRQAWSSREIQVEWLVGRPWARDIQVEESVNILLETVRRKAEDRR